MGSVKQPERRESRNREKKDLLARGKRRIEKAETISQDH